MLDKKGSEFSLPDINKYKYIRISKLNSEINHIFIALKKSKVFIESPLHLRISYLLVLEPLEALN